MGRVKQQRHMTIQKKSHYKMFKAGKCWLYSEIAMLSVLTGVMVGTESAQASTDGKTDNSAVVITDQNISDNTNSTETLTTATKTNNPSDVPESQQETTDTGQVNVQVSTDQTTIQSGQTAKFNVSVVASGINNDQTKNSQLTVQLPTNNELADDSDLSIMGVVPTIDDSNHQLVYQFNEQLTGTSFSKQYEFQTQTGTTVNGTTLSLSASYDVEDQTLVSTTSAVVTIESKADYGATNQMIGVMPQDENGNIATDENGSATINKNKLTGVAGDLIAYEFGLSAPKTEAGQVYFEPGSQVIIRYLLPTSMTYVGVDSSTPQPSSITNQDGFTVIDFYLQAPSLAEQAASTGNIFGYQYYIIARINTDVAAHTKITTYSQAVANSINGDRVVSNQAASTIETAVDLSKGLIPVDGSAYYIYNWGPADGKGTMGSSGKNIDPQVYPNATLAFMIQLGSADFDYPTPTTTFNGKGEVIPYTGNEMITSYAAEYDIDDHLNLKTMFIGQPIAWIHGHEEPLTENPIFDVYVKYQDSENYEATPNISGITKTDGTLDMTQYVDNNRGVDKLKFVWTKTVAGQTYENIRFTMSPKAGYYGTVANDLTAYIGGFNAEAWMNVRIDKNGEISLGAIDGTTTHYDGQDVHMFDEVGNYDASLADLTATYNQFLNTQTAEIVKPAEDTPGVLNENLAYVNTNGEQVNPGANQLAVTVENNQAALQSISGLVSYVVLPKGVSYVGNDGHITAAKKGDETWLTIKWDQTTLAPNDQNKLLVDVNIDPNLNLTALTTRIYSIVNENDTVVPSSLDATTNSSVLKVADNDNLDGNIATAYLYTLTSTQLVATPFANHVLSVNTQAKNNDEETGSLVTVRQNEDGKFLLNLNDSTDKALQNFELVATLPSVDDTAVLDTSEHRGSQTALKLAGPVILPTSWQDKVTVLYITTEHPEGIIINDNGTLDYQTVTGFKIIYDGSDYLDGGQQQITVPVVVTEANIVGEVSYMSFSAQANGLAATEGLKAGIVVGAKTPDSDDNGNPGTDPNGNPETNPTTPAENNPETQPSGLTEKDFTINVNAYVPAKQTKRATTTANKLPQTDEKKSLGLLVAGLFGLAGVSLESRKYKRH